ncbi:peptide deformylase [Sulfurimonas autotrophica]|uniref:Formylmethionine deformylase n=1 Tax=Sulfurimonas autotrophica (strain ATCC BAA-671 / DSM 16294 / JCM 11897 / OK10) TaxID=563040 RepID=E0USV1_SULAO|nr:peptide deformylase [Sulfurimonas autotrophica]ADN08128.1 formylmethionine deformylase [Sulfurimonas autotrophica DSM 16294]
MVKEIIKYPTTPSLEFGANVRHFNQELFDLIKDLKDTIEANNLDALSAFQIGSPYAVIVIKKDDGEFLELINPRIIKREGTITPVESTAYFPGLSAKTKRYEKIKLMYEDRDANQQFLEAEGDLAVTIQRKLDYVFGSNFRVRLDDNERKLLDSKLEFGTDAITDNGCPTTFKRDKLLHLIKFVFVASLLALITKFFLSEENLSILKSAENYAMLSILILTVIYFFYAIHEGKQYKNCSSCQIGNIIGVTGITLAKLLVLFGANYFLLW